MTNRNIKKELLYSHYIDMEDGNDTETIDYDSLICILTELVDRIEKLENAELKARVEALETLIKYGS